MASRKTDLVMLRWWFLAFVEIAGLAALLATGMARKLWSADVTKLSIVCLVALLIATGFIGWITQQAHYDLARVRRDKIKLKRLAMA